ncbi:SMI1/KNR4 family protein [Singulisphaera sp. Ch08]|uniref:SMI1/KNR4 family protein n=1 Tax=Singulisphaera sp. Ch08 TaxID=3120278 RepID=A0AAU7C6H7_9BACT
MGLNRYFGRVPRPEMIADTRMFIAQSLGFFALYLPALATLTVGGIGLILRKPWGYEIPELIFVNSRVNSIGDLIQFTHQTEISTMMNDASDRVASEILKLAATGRFPPRFYGPVSEETIVQAENELNLKFPYSYREFLRHFGAAYMLGYSFDGLTNPDPDSAEMPDFLNLVDTAKQDWKGIAGIGMPEYLLLFTHDGGDFGFYIDTSIHDERGESPILIFGPGADGIQVATDFLDFLRKKSKRERLY